MVRFKKYKYISFDLFDTLIKRDVEKPTDVFKIVENIINKSESEIIENFSIKRRNAEINLYPKKVNEEITLDEIYANFSESYNQELLSKYKLEEENTEISLCTFNLNIKDIYDQAVKSGSKILITTDIYLSEKVIRSILDNNNIKYDYLFISSEIKLKKKTKNLFKYILKKLNIKENEIIHIGDNFKSDYLNPKLLGIRSIKIKNKISNVAFENNNSSFEYRCLKKFINNRIHKYLDFYKKIGYETLGPLLYGFCMWLNNELKEKSISDILFFSRDGLIIKKAFEELFDKKYNSKYFYASRRALIIPNLCESKNIDDIFSNFSLPKEIKINSLINKVGLEIDNNMIKKIKDNCFSFEESINRDDIYNKESHIYRFLSDILETIKFNSANEKKYRNEYFLNNLCDIKNSKLAIVDIGWFGNMQNNFEKHPDLYNNKEVYGYYVGLVPNESNKFNLNMKGFMFDTLDKDKELYYREKNFNSLFELFFSGTHGTVLKYSANGSVKVADYEYDKKQEEILNSLQLGAIDFIKDYKRSLLSNYMTLSKDDCISDLLSLGNNPNMNEINKFGNLNFLDNELRTILNFKGRRFYLLHPSKILSDFKKSQWKIAFLKKTFIIKMPYEKICRKLRGKING